MKIDMSHGSGGKASETLMADIFGKHFSNDILDKMEDAAVLSVPGKIAFSTDSFVVTPLFFKGGDIGKLAVCGTVNDLLMMGATPKYLTCGFIIEEGMDVDALEKIVVSMKAAAEEAGVKIVAGDTKVVENNTGNSGVFINTSGIGLIFANLEISGCNCQPGDVILLSGNLGDHHACILSNRMDIENEIQSDCAPLNSIVLPLLEAGIAVRAMRDVTRGGLGTILNELARSSDVAFVVEEEAIPVSDEVKGFSDILGLDPMYMGNEGKMVAVVPAEDAERALAIMKASPYGKDAAIVAQVRAGAGVTVETRIGGERVLDVLYGEGLPRIC